MPVPLNHAYRWTSIGGHLALDLCNTVSWRLDPARLVDRLGAPGDLVDWFGTVTDLTAADRRRLARHLVDHPGEAEKALQSAKELRNATIRVIDAQLAAPDHRAARTTNVERGDVEIWDVGTTDDGTTDDETTDVDLIGAAWRAALAVATTRPRLPWSWQVEPTGSPTLVHVLALSVADLLHRPDQSGLRRCDGEGCGWLFLDTTRNHSRRWCDPLDCGNRARVRSYAERHRRTR